MISRIVIAIQLNESFNEDDFGSKYYIYVEFDKEFNQFLENEGEKISMVTGVFIMDLKTYDGVAFLEVSFIEP